MTQLNVFRKKMSALPRFAAPITEADHPGAALNKELGVNTTHSLTRIISAAGLAGAVWAAGLVGLGAGSAQAQPGFAPLATWCPGQQLPGSVAGDWDMNACHEWHYSWHDDPHAPAGQVVQGPVDCWAIFPQCLY
jgi:hypothetical protein